MTEASDRLLFRTAALFNWGAVLLLLPLFGLSRRLGVVAAGNSFYDHIALLAVAGFGYGYWLVSRDPASHRGIVLLGLLLKIGVVALGVAHYLGGTLNLTTLALIAGDLIYALLFARHLRRNRASARR